MKKIIVVVVITALLVIQACKPKSENPLDSYDRGKMLSDIYTSAIAPLHQTFTNEAVQLKTKAEVFETTPNLANLEAIQQQWLVTQQAWQTCEPINVGDVRESFINTKINSWPTNTVFIENFIAGSDVLNEAFIHSKGTTSKGFPALEYLIFSTDNNALLQQLTANPRRIQYAVAVAGELSTNAATVKSLWASYQPSFVSSTSLAIDGSVNLLVNALLEYEEFIKNDKVGAPLGKKTNNIAQPTSVESDRSNASIQHIISNLDGIDAMLNGTATGANGNGLYAYLNAVDPMADGTKLSDKIKGQIILCRNAANAINGTLEEAVVNNPDQVDVLYVELKKLTVLLKVEMTSILGVTVTFTDNDGD